eukprot:5463738-Amphidinium_carterae.1
MRALAFQQMLARAGKLQADKDQLHKHSSGSHSRIVAKKRILLWRELMEEACFAYSDAARLFEQGACLVGMADAVEAFPLETKLLMNDVQTLRCHA